MHVPVDREILLSIIFIRSSLLLHRPPTIFLQDDAYAKRVLTQRLQQRDWASQQLQERARIEAEEREFDRLQELQMQQAALVR